MITRPRSLVIPVISLVLAAAVAVHQVRHDRQPPPPLVAQTGLRVYVGHTTGDGSAPRCRPPQEALETELVSLQRVRFDPSVRICDATQPGPFTIEEWGSGRIIWRPHVALEIERW